MIRDSMHPGKYVAVYVRMYGEDLSSTVFEFALTEEDAQNGHTASSKFWTLCPNREIVVRALYRADLFGEEGKNDVG